MDKEFRPNLESTRKESGDLDTRAINRILRAFWSGKDTSEKYNDVAEEFLRELKGLGSEEQVKLLGEAFRTLAHGAKEGHLVDHSLD